MQLRNTANVAGRCRSYAARRRACNNRRAAVVRRAVLSRDESLPYTGAKQLPEPFAVPLKVVPRTGGSETQHALITERALGFGELLMACKPLGVAFAAAEEVPGDEALMQQLSQQTFTPTQRQLLTSLQHSAALEMAPSQLVHGGLQQQSSEGASASGGDSSQDAAAGVGAGVLEEVVRRHALTAPSQDFPSCVVREESVSSYRGLWPAASTLPHSCACNTHEYVIGDTLLVRAAAPLDAGAHLTRNYLGMQAFTPLSVRRELLRAGWGLHCTCPRCMAEEKNEGVQQAVQSAYEAVQTLSDAWVKAHDSGDTAAAAAVQERLSGHAAAVEGALRAASLPIEEEGWLTAGALAVFNLIFSMKAAAGVLDVESKEAELRCLEALAAGTDAHVYAALHNYVQVLITYGDQTLEEERAQERVNMAHVARYGLMQQDVLARLSEVRFNDVIPLYSQEADGVAVE